MQTNALPNSQVTPAVAVPPTGGSLANSSKETNEVLVSPLTTTWTEPDAPIIAKEPTQAVVPVSATISIQNSSSIPNSSEPDPKNQKQEATSQRAVGDVLQYALEHHPALRIRQHEVEAARARLLSARLFTNPEFMLQTASPTDAPGPTELTTRLMFTVPLGPKRAWQTAVAQTGIYESQMALSRETKTILTEAADAAVEVLYFQEQEALYDQLAKLSNDVVAMQKERFKIAAVPYRNVVLTELSSHNMELARRNTTARLNQAKVRLARAMGMSDASPPPVAGQLTAEPLVFSPLPVVLSRAGQTSPELSQACGAIQESKQQQALEQWKAVPDVALGPRLQNDLSGTPNDRFGGRLQIDVPIFDRNQGNIAESAADVQTNCAKYDLIKITTLNDVASLYVELQDTQARAEYYKTSIQPLTERTETALREAFEDRAVTAYELADLLESLARMKLSDLDLRHQHQRLRTRLELLLECPISSLGGGELPAAPPESIPVPQQVPIPPKIGDQPAS